MLVVVLCSAVEARAQGTVPPEPRSPLDARNWGVVYDVPATKKVQVRESVPYLGDGKDALTIDLYTPPGASPAEELPAVVFVNGIGDSPGDPLKRWGIYRAWPRLVAAHGLIGVSMDADAARIPECLRGVFDFLAKRGAEYGVDGSRLGLYAASANVGSTYTYLIGENAAPGIRAAALFYGGVPEGRIRADLPVLLIFPQGDLAGSSGAALPGLWGRVVEAKAPWSLLFASNLPHAFDAVSDNDEARRIIQQSIAFWKSNLEPVPPPPWKPSPERAIAAATFGNDSQKLVDLLGPWIQAHPEDSLAYVLYGRALASLHRAAEATAAYEKAVALGAKEPGVLVGMGMSRLAQQQYRQAAEWLSKAIDAGAASSQTYGSLAMAQLMEGQNEKGVKSYEKAFALGIPPGAGTRGVAYFNLACGYARLGRKDDAMTAVANAVAEGFGNRQAYETDADLASLANEPRFREIVARLPN
jgi:tetratricopeptide (TPR) repeat protein